MGVQLEIDLLGTFRLRYQGDPVDAMNSARLQELLTYLILHRDAPQQRQHIAMKFWPDSPAKQTLANLRQLLFQLRKALPESESCIRADTNTLQWDPELPCRIDLAEFERHIDQARRSRNEKDTAGEIEALEQAVSVYGGRLLPHCFEEWIAGTRNRLQEEYAGALKRLVACFEEQRRYDKGIVYAGKRVEQNPTDESAARKLMQLHAFNEDRASVVRTYRELEKRMQEELDIEPGQETSELFRRLTERYTTGESGDRLKTERAREREPNMTAPEENWPLVGRTAEWKRLAEAWKKALSGVMQGVLIRGEPGIGKSRLGRDFLNHLGRQGYGVAWARCHESPGTPGYGPLANWLRTEPFRSRVGQLDPVWRDEVARLLPELSHSDARGNGDENVDGDDTEHRTAGRGTSLRVQEPGGKAADREPWLQTRFEEALVRAILQEDRPAALMLEGLQWCDSETLGWFNNLLNRNRPAPLLLVATLRRPAERPADPDALESLLLALRRNHSLHEIELEPFDRDETAELASLVLDRDIDDEMGSLIYEETEGNPLFIVETAREIHQLEELRERDDDEFVAPDETRSRLRPLPRVVSDVILDRFRHLSSKARMVLGIASVAGRGFSFIHLRHCCDLGVSELVDALEELVDRNILRELEPEWYDFRHDKLREVAYKSLGDIRKRRLHRNMALALLEIRVDDPAALHRRMAFHCERAGDHWEAVEHYRMAARYAGRGTVRQDIGMLRRALKLLEEIPETGERDSQELEITTSLALAILQRRNFDRDEMFRVCSRVHELCSDLGEPPPVAILMALGIASLWTGDPSAAVELGMVMHSLSAESDDYRGYAEACYLLGLSHRVLGDIGEAVDWCRKGMDYYGYIEEECEPFVHLQAYDLDGRIQLMMETARTLVLSGCEEESREIMMQTLEKTRKSGRQTDIACVWFNSTRLEMLLRNARDAREAVRQFLTMELEVEPLYWNVQVNIVQGWLVAEKEGSSGERGAERIRRGIRRLEEEGRTVDLPLYYGLLAEVLTGAGAFDEALDALERGRAIMNETGARFAAAELYRIEGELLLASRPADPEGAKDAFSSALETARRQGCRLFESRAAKALEQIG